MGLGGRGRLSIAHPGALRIRFRLGGGVDGDRAPVPISAFQGLLPPIQRIPHSQPRLLHYVRVDLGGLDTLVPQQILHRPDGPLVGRG